jgi:hypothetical protein
MHAGPSAFDARFSPNPKGGAASLGVAIGASVLLDSLVLFADLNGVSQGEGDEVSVSMLGVGVAYWWMPVNVYFSGSVGTGRAQFDAISSRRDETRPGAQLHLMAGKEWLLDGGPWGIGAALTMRHGSFPEGEFNSVGVVFSATLN